MYIDLISDTTKTLGPFDKVEIVGVTLIADGQDIAYFDHFWSEDRGNPINKIITSV